MPEGSGRRNGTVIGSGAAHGDGASNGNGVAHGSGVTGGATGLVGLIAEAEA
jgi:hypothetical protein